MSETDGSQGCVKVSGHRRVALRCERVKRGTEEARPAHEHFRSVQPSILSHLTPIRHLGKRSYDRVTWAQRVVT